jgi:hypothetical protein
LPAHWQWRFSLVSHSRRMDLVLEAITERRPRPSSVNRRSGRASGCSCHPPRSNVRFRGPNEPALHFVNARRIGEIRSGSCRSRGVGSRRPHRAHAVGSSRPTGMSKEHGPTSGHQPRSGSRRARAGRGCVRRSRPFVTEDAVWKPAGSTRSDSFLKPNRVGRLD